MKKGKNKRKTTVEKPIEISSFKKRLYSWYIWIEKNPSLFLFLFALIIRLLYLFILSTKPGFEIPVVDEVEYHNLGILFSHGEGWGPFTLFRPPLWPTFLGILYVLFGPWFPIARIFNVLFGSLAVVSLYKTGSKLFNHKTGLIAGLIFSLYGYAIHLSTSGLNTALAVYLLLEAVNFYLDARKTKKIKPALLSGLLWALASMAHPSCMLAAAFPLIDFWFTMSKVGEEWPRRVLIFIVGFIIGISPATIHNLRYGDLVPISANGGINLYIGNHPTASGYAAHHPDLGVWWTPHTAHYWVEDKVGHKMKPGEVSAWYSREAVKFWFSQPGIAAKLLAKKFYLSIGAIEISNNGDIAYLAQNNFMLAALMRIGWGVIMPFGIIGIILTWRKYPASRVVSSVALSFMVLTTLFFVAGRFRFPAVPFLILFASWAFLNIFNQSCYSKIQRYSFYIIILTITVFINLNIYALPVADISYGYFIQGKILAQEGKDEEAIKYFEKCLAELPRVPLANYYIGQIKLQQEKPREALKYFNRELIVQPKALAFRGIGLTYRFLAEKEIEEIEQIKKRSNPLLFGSDTINVDQLTQQHFIKSDSLRALATQAFYKAYTENEEDPNSQRLLAQEIGEQAINASENGNWDKAIELFGRAKEIDENNPFFDFGLAGAIWMKGEKERANKIIDGILAENPHFVPAIEWKKEGWRPNKKEDEAIEKKN